MLLFSSEKEWINALNKSWLASKCIKEQDYTTALLHYIEALHIWHEFIDNAELNCTLDIALIYQRLARCYQYHIKDQILAEKHYLDAIQYFKLGIKRATTPYERMKIYEKLSYLEKHRTKLVGYDAENVEMILRYEELSIANMFEHYKTDRAKLGETHRQLAELRKFQREYDESLVHYQHALEIFRHQPFEFDFYLIICDIIDNMTNIYIEEKMCDYLSAMEYQSIKHTYILKHMTYVNLSQQESRCVNQCDLAKSQIELAYIYLLMEERETALMHLSGAVASYREFGNVDVIDYKKFRHGRLQEQLANMSLQAHRHDEAYEYLKKSRRCLQEQKYMLEVILQLKPDDTVSYLKHRREWDKLNAREQMLADKLTKSEKGKKIQMKKQMAFAKFSWSIWYRL